MPVARALDAAHTHGLVHRDVKPANILLQRSPSGGIDHVYLSDFGVTKHVSSVSGLTKTGALVGTLDYVAPEQIEGHDVTAQTDVYALGCLFYQCVTGRVPAPSGVRCGSALGAHARGGRAGQQGSPRAAARDRRRDREGARKGSVGARFADL